MNHLSKKYTQLSQQFNSLTMRERGIVFLGAIVSVYIAWSSLVLDRLELQSEELNNIIAQAELDSKLLEIEFKGLGNKTIVDPNEEVRTQLGQLRQQIDNFKQQSAEATEALIAPSQMVHVLEDLLTRELGLQLISLDTNGSKPLVAKLDEQKTKGKNETVKKKAKLFAHAFSVEFEGDYLATLKYLVSLESLPWKFFWDAVEFEVIEYPQARVRIDLHTLGLTEGWIGV